MALEDPVAVYNATNNIEAHLVKMWLVDAGIEAFVLEDLSTAGIWMFGALPEIHKPQVWISKADRSERSRSSISTRQDVAERNRANEQIRLGRRAADRGGLRRVRQDVAFSCQPARHDPGLSGMWRVCRRRRDRRSKTRIWLEAEEPDEPHEA